MSGSSKVPSPLCFPDGGKDLFHLFFFCSLIPGSFSFDVASYKKYFKGIPVLNYFILAAVYINYQLICFLAVTNLARSGDIIKRALDVMVCEFKSSLTHERHVAIGT